MLKKATDNTLKKTGNKIAIRIKKKFKRKTATFNLGKLNK